MKHYGIQAGHQPGDRFGVGASDLQLQPVRTRLQCERASRQRCGWLHLRAVQVDRFRDGLPVQLNPHLPVIGGTGQLQFQAIPAGLLYGNSQNQPAADFPVRPPQVGVTTPRSTGKRFELLPACCSTRHLQDLQRFSLQAVP